MKERYLHCLYLLLVALPAACLPSLMTVRSGWAGYDYLYFIPRLFEGMLFILGQGFRIPLYSVSFCGGLPYFGDPQTLFYSLPQLLTVVLSPWASIITSSVVILIVGAASFFFLIRDVFKLSNLSAVLAGVLFASNGFYRHRMLIGHLTYQSFALIPLVALLLFSQKISNRLAAVLIAFTGAYFVHSGGHFVSFIMVPALISVICLRALCAVKSEDRVWGAVFVRGLSGMLGALALSAGKLIAVISFMRQFPRRAGFDEPLELFDGLKLVAGQLFWPELYKPYDWGHWEYVASVTPLALLLVVPGVCFVAYGLLIRRSVLRLFVGLTLIVCLLVTFQFATSGGVFFELLKDIPPFSSLRIGMRFTSVYIFFIVVSAAIGLECIRSVSCKQLIAGVVMAAAFLQPAFEGKTVVGYMSFSLDSHDSFNQYLKEALPAATRLQRIERGRGEDLAIMSRFSSNRACLAPNFKRSPARRLQLGPVEQTENGYFNFTDPSCYAYPEVRGCKPGDRIRVSDRVNFERLRLHRNPDWPVSAAQKAGNLISVFALFMLVAIGIYEITLSAWRKR